jgi:hypothetical protein
MKRSFAILLAGALAANAPLTAWAQNHGGGGGGGSRPPQQSRPAPPPQSQPAQPPQSRPAQPPQQSRPAQPPSGARPPGFNLGDETRPPSRPPSGGNTAYKPPPSGGNNGNYRPPNNGGNNGNRPPPNNGGNNGNYRPPNGGGNYHRPPPPPPPGPYRPGYYGGRPIIVNPIYPPGPAWGWNRGVAWYPAPTYWGGGFWGALAIGVTSAAVGAAVYGSIVADNTTYTSYQVQPNSPGATLLVNYQLTQTQCGPPNLVVIYGPNDSVICAYPNNLVSPGAYQLDPTQLSIVAIQ